MPDTSDKPAWVRGGLRLTKAVLTRLDEEARLAYARGEESCGFLAGPAVAPLLVDTIIPMDNRANALHELDPVAYPRTGRMYFDIDGLAFDRKVRAQAALGQPVKVLYHSHLDVGAYFSDTDATAATMGGDAPPYDLVYLVTSVRAGVVDDRRMFAWQVETRGFTLCSFAVAEDAG